jgi:hypothetical protein
MLAHAPGQTASIARDLMNKAECAGLSLGSSSYTALLSQLQLEGRQSEMDNVLAEMCERGIEHNERTTAVLERSSEELSKMRTTELQNNLKSGELEAAWELFDGLLERGIADDHQLSVMLAHAPGQTTSTARDLMNKAERAGLSLGVCSYTALLGNLKNSRTGRRRLMACWLRCVRAASSQTRTRELP